MILIRNVIWIAGLLEGEGCFSIQNKQPKIVLNMTDLDVVIKVRDILNPKINIYPIAKEGNRKPQYQLACCGELAIQWMMTLISLMGIRRKNRIKIILKIWRDKPFYKGYCRKKHKIEGDNAVDNGKGRLICRQCRKERSDKYYEENRELIKERHLKSYQKSKDPEIAMTRILMKTKNISFEEAQKQLIEGIKNAKPS